MSTKTEIHVPALVEGDKVIVPQFWLGRDVEYRTDRSGYALSVAEYNKEMQLPTLAELRHAYFDKNADGPYVSPDYRKSVLSEREYGEWTSTFLRAGKEAIERPERVYYDIKHKLWVAEGGKVTRVELQPEGWILEYDKLTGFPSRTSSDKKDARKVFGDDASYFRYNFNGLRAVFRASDILDDGPFCVDASCEPDGGDLDVGARACRRSEQDVKRLATPVHGKKRI